MEQVNSIQAPVVPVQVNAGMTPQYSDNRINLKDIYSQEEIESIVSKFGCLHTSSPNGQRCEFDLSYIPNSETVVINNKNMTNDTVEIDKNGGAISVGSWHRKEIPGNYSDIINDVKTKTAELQKNKEAKISTELDSMAAIGKSQVTKFDDTKKEV